MAEADEDERDTESDILCLSLEAVAALGEVILRYDSSPIRSKPGGSKVTGMM